ncbi:hypothetical protein Rs2_38820 [Raphanus sativus]|nr:hypothetical protein Rs2_38820 [Raphanus sativus]
MRKLYWDDPNDVTNEDSESEKAITLAFCPKKCKYRKRLIETYLNGGLEQITMDDNDEKTKETIQETIVNGGLKETSVLSLSYANLINKELIMFFVEDVQMSFLSFFDGLKLDQRKALFCALSVHSRVNNAM